MSYLKMITLGGERYAFHFGQVNKSAQHRFRAQSSCYYWGASFHSVKFKKKRVLTTLGSLLYKADVMAEIEGYIRMPCYDF